jgi:Ca-activated chloride channel family protein
MSDFLKHFVFAEPGWLWMLLLVLPIFLLSRRRGTEASLGFPSLSILASVGRRPLFRPGTIAATFFAFALISGILALARPQWRDDYTARTASGIDILIALDVSFSMEIADFYPNDDRRRPPKRRIEAAKEVINMFIEQRPDDRIGLVAFAGRPYAVSPITLDHEWLRLNLSRLQLGDISEQGTAIGSAIAASGTRLTKRETKSKILVLVTDGANNSGKLDPVEAARHAAALGIRTYTVAIGSEEGRVSRMRQTMQQQEFDETTLREIAKITKGEFFRAKTTSSLQKTFESINELERSEIKSQTVVETEEWFLWLVLASTVLCFFGLAVTGLNPPPMP